MYKLQGLGCSVCYYVLALTVVSAVLVSKSFEMSLLCSAVSARAAPLPRS